MKKTLRLIEKFQLLARGENVASSSLRGDWVEQMLMDNILQKVSHGRRLSYHVTDIDAFRRYIATKYDIRNIEAAKRMLGGNEQETSRAGLVAMTGDSKFVHHRTMTGFLVNSYMDIPAEVNGRPFTIHPPEGTFIYIYDFRTFSIPSDVVVIGVENSENFRRIACQKYLFGAYPKVLFVSRYPQNGDLIRWLEKIPNHYVHFGDFDLAGIHIFLSEFYARLGNDRSEFFIPQDIRSRLPMGNSSRYDVQYHQYARMEIADRRLRELVDAIHQAHRGYDQEGYIRDE
jgi:hypothetical protein